MRFREKARQPNARYIGPGEPGQFKGKKRKNPAKGKGIKGRLSTRLIFRATPLYQDHVCYSPLGTILVKIHASYFYISNRSLSLMERRQKLQNHTSYIQLRITIFHCFLIRLVVVEIIIRFIPWWDNSVIINILLVTFNSFSPMIVGLRSQSIVHLIYLIKQPYIQ